MTKPRGYLLSEELAGNVRDMARGHKRGTAAPTSGGTPFADPPLLATTSTDHATGAIAAVVVKGSDETYEEVYNRGPAVPSGTKVHILWTAGDEVDLANGVAEDDAGGQWEIIPSGAAGAGGGGDLPTGTTDCDCSNCIRGTPVAEDDPYYATCKCKNRKRHAQHDPLVVKLSRTAEDIEWPESGGVHTYIYKGNGIWETKKFPGYVCGTEGEGEEAEDIRDEYKYVLNAITQRLTLTFVPPTEGAEPLCPLIEAEWCIKGGACGTRCLCPWVFTTDMPWRNIKPPKYCNLCVTPVGKIQTDPCGCSNRLPIAIRIIGEGLCDFDPTGEYVVPATGLNGEHIFYLSEYEWPCGSEPAPWEPGPGTRTKYSLDGPCGGWQIFFCQSTILNLYWSPSESEALTDSLVLHLAPVPGCDGTEQEATLTDSYVFYSGCTESTLKYELMFESDVALGSGDQASDCAPADPCEDAECVREVVVIGGVKVYVDSDQSTCDGCGSCTGTPCNPFTDDECGNADDHPEWYLCRKPCLPDAELPETVSLTFSEYMLPCPCGASSMQLCLDEGDGHYRGSNVLCGAGHSWEYYEDGGLWYLVRDGAATASSADPAGPFLFGEVPGGDPCGSLSVTVS